VKGINVKLHYSLLSDSEPLDKSTLSNQVHLAKSIEKPGLTSAGRTDTLVIATDGVTNYMVDH